MKQEAGVALPDAGDPKPQRPSSKPKAPPMSQKQQLGLTLGIVALVLVALLALIFWPSSRKTAATASEAAEATPEEIQKVISTLETSDPELTRLLNSYSEDWAASGAGQNPDIAEKLRGALNSALQSKTKDRMEAARRAEIVTAELAKLQAVAPSLKALKQAAE
jgi:hypothetical protein